MPCGVFTRRNSKGRFCSFSCQQKLQREAYIGRWMGGMVSGLTLTSVSNYVRSYLFSLQEGKCLRCDRSCWMGKPIPLEIDHKDGNFLTQPQPTFDYYVLLATRWLPRIKGKIEDPGVWLVPKRWSSRSDDWKIVACRLSLRIKVGKWLLENVSPANKFYGAFFLFKSLLQARMQPDTSKEFGHPKVAFWWGGWQERVRSRFHKNIFIGKAEKSLCWLWFWILEWWTNPSTVRAYRWGPLK